MPTAAAYSKITTAGAPEKGQQINSQLVPQDSAPKLTVTKMTLPDPYVAGGIQLTAANLGLTTLYAVLSVIVLKPDTGVYRAQLDTATRTKLVIALDDAVSGVPAESGAVSLTGVDVQIVALGA